MVSVDQFADVRNCLQISKSNRPPTSGINYKVFTSVSEYLLPFVLMCRRYFFRKQFQAFAFLCVAFASSLKRLDKEKYNLRSGSLDELVEFELSFHSSVTVITEININ